MKKTSFVLFCTFLIASAASAADAKKAAKKHTETPVVTKVDHAISGQGYDMAGCGLGSIVLGDKPGIVQIFAATTNGTSGSQTFGISTGTSNCDAGNKNATASLFVLTNREALAKDISRGNGETLNSYSKIIGCNNSNELGNALQKNYKEIFPTAAVAPIDVNNKVNNIIHEDKTLAATCKAI